MNMATATNLTASVLAKVFERDDNMYAGLPCLAGSFSPGL
jgi:hypothetical protein